MKNKTILRDIGLIKNYILTPILASNDVMEIMLGTGYTEEQVYGKEDGTGGIVYHQIFPYLYIDDTLTQAAHYLCFEVDIPKFPTAVMKDMKITIWAYCRMDCMKYSKEGYCGTNADILADAVERVLRSSAPFGIGQIQLESVTCLNSENNNYYGRQLVFTFPDFKVK